MTFENKINLTEEEILESVKNDTILDVVGSIKGLVMVMFHQYKEKNFDKDVMTIRDIQNSICRYIQDNEPSNKNIILLKIFIRNLSNFTINHMYIIENWETLKISIDSCIKKSTKLISTQE